MKSINCSIIRGGTSKGVFLFEDDLPQNIKQRNQFLLDIMGSPDINQINGLGGGQSVTSKIAIIKKSSMSGIDVDYTFAQVSVDKPLVSYAGNCGNILSAVGVFAIDNHLVDVKNDYTIVKIYNTNTNKVIEEKIETPNKKVNYFGDYKISGVAGAGSPIKVTIKDPAGTLSNLMLPTGKTKELLNVGNIFEIEASIVDVSNPLVFIKAKDVGFTGKEQSNDIDKDIELLNKLEMIRGAAAVKLGLIKNISDSATLTPGVPKIAIIAPPIDYETITGEAIANEDYNISSRMMSMQKTHPSYALTGALCTVAAAIIPGTIVHEIATPFIDNKDNIIKIGHPSGLIEAGIEYINNGNVIDIKSVSSFRTARLILKGLVFIK